MIRLLFFLFCGFMAIAVTFGVHESSKKPAVIDKVKHDTIYHIAFVDSDVVTKTAIISQDEFRRIAP